MTRIYIVRHCEALGNVMKLFQGTSDFDITQLGEEQLGFLTNRFDKISLERVIASPLIRTRKTGKAIIGNKNIPLETNEGLIELDGGIIEGKPFIESCMAFPEMADAWANHPEDFATEGGESMKHAYVRIWDTVLKIAEENKGKTVACATHGGVTRCLICRLLFGDIKELKNTGWSNNTAVSLVEFDDNMNPKLIFYNDTSHLPDDMINRASKVITSVSEGEK